MDPNVTQDTKSVQGETVAGLFHPYLKGSSGALDVVSALPVDTIAPQTKADTIVTTAKPTQTAFNNYTGDLNTMLGGLNQKPTTGQPKIDMNDPYMKSLNALSVSSNASTKALLNTIMAQRANQGNSINGLYDNYKRGLQMLGIQHNEAQFTPDLLLGHVKAAEAEQQQKLQNLDVQMNKDMMDAEKAQKENDFTTLKLKMEHIKELKQEQQDYLKNIADQMGYEQKIAASQVTGIYDQLQKLSPKDKEKYLSAVAQKYGLSLGSLATALSEIKQEREDRSLDVESKKATLAHTRALTANVDKDGETPAKQQSNAIATAILGLEEQVKKNNWKGIDPTQYAEVEKIIKEDYGSAALLAFRKAYDESEYSIDDGTQ